MATRFRSRRSLLLAVLLALIAAATLCVWGAAAAGYTFSSPALQAFIDAITRRGDELALDENGGGGGPSDGIMAAAGNGDGDGEGGESAAEENGSDAGRSAANQDNCLFGLICLDAAVEAGDRTKGNGGDVNLDLDTNLTTQGRTRCFLGLICLTANVDADAETKANIEGGDINASLATNVSSGNDSRSLLDAFLSFFFRVD